MKLKRFELADKLAALRVDVIWRENASELAKSDKTAFEEIARLLHEMEVECRSGNLRPKERRYGAIARLAIETDPAALPSELADQLIEAENAYRKL